MSPRAIGTTTQQPRPSTALEIDLPLYGPLSVLSTISEPENETWGHLLSMAAIQRFKVAARLHGLGAQQAQAIFPSARAFLHQAHDYFRAAKTVSDRSAPLFHYYALLNLAKFAISLSQPSRLAQNADLYHGLSVVRGAKSPKTAELQTHRGVFTTLAEVLTQEGCGPQRLRVRDLLARCTDVGAEYSDGWKRNGESTGCVVTVALNRSADMAWVRLRLLHPGPALMAPTWPRVLAPGGYLRSHFSEVQQSVAPVVLATFDSDATVTTSGKSDDEIAAELREWLWPLRLISEGTEVPLGRTGNRRIYALPHNFRGRPPVAEMNTILAVSFYFSHVVRYNPYLFEDWQRSPDSWIATTFGRNGPAKFVRLGLDFALGQTHVFNQI